MQVHTYFFSRHDEVHILDHSMVKILDPQIKYCGKTFDKLVSLASWNLFLETRFHTKSRTPTLQSLGRRAICYLYSSLLPFQAFVLSPIDKISRGTGPTNGVYSQTTMASDLLHLRTAHRSPSRDCISSPTTDRLLQASGHHQSLVLDFIFTYSFPRDTIKFTCRNIYTTIRNRSHFNGVNFA